MGDLYDIQMADRPWTRDRVILLLDGEARRLRRSSVDEWYDDVTGPTANDLRQAAYAGGPIALIDDVIQLEQSVATIVDDEVRNFLMLRLRTDCSPQRIADALGCERSALHVESRGVDLVLRDLRMKREQVRRVAGEKRESPVCWRCMRRYVEQPGDLCSEACTGGRMRPSEAREPRNVPLADRPDPSTMTALERAAEIEELVERHEGNLVPGLATQRKREVTLFDD
jgi:hypothetical protein